MEFLEAYREALRKVFGTYRGDHLYFEHKDKVQTLPTGYCFYWCTWPSYKKQKLNSFRFCYGEPNRLPNREEMGKYFSELVAPFDF